MISLENLPTITKDTFEIVKHEFWGHQHADTIDIEIIKALIKRNDGLTKMMRTLVEVCNNDDEYRMMITGISIMLKLIDIQLGVNKMEESACE